MTTVTKFKMFMGCLSDPADEKANKWLEEHPNIDVVDFKYQQARYGDHSICIKYTVYLDR